MSFEIYKRGQGKYTRLCSSFGPAVIAAFGCLALYRKLEPTDLGLWVETMVPFGLLVVICIVIFWLVNKPTVADFMIAAESEMKKVSWSSRKEIVVSTIIVVVVMVFMASLLGVADISFRLLFDMLLR